MSLNDLATKIHDNAVDKGFWDDKGEAAREALESLRMDDVFGTLKDRLDIIEDALPKEPRNFAEMLMLICSEMGESLEEHRAGKEDHYYSVTVSPAAYLPFGEVYAINGRFYSDPDGTHEITMEAVKAAGAKVKPEGTAVELVDGLIRILDTLHSRGVDIDALVEEKMEYNSGRARLHGKAY